MHRALIALIFSGAAMSAESLSGVVSGPDGPLEFAELRIRSAKGDVQDFTTTADGAYRFTVTPGTFDIFIVRTGYSSLAKRGYTIPKGADARLDFPLAITTNEGTPGEYPTLWLRDHTPVITGLVPKLRTGVPDLSGVWLPGQPTEFDDPMPKPWAAALARERNAGGAAADPRAWCLPSGTVRTNNSDLTKFVHTPDLLVILIEGVPPGFRQIFLKQGSKHPANVEPTWMGHSIGHWEGETLVVDTIGFHDRGWIDGGGRPQTDQLHVIERFRRTSRGVMDVAITVDDPGAYEKPWTFHRILHLTESDDIREAICNEDPNTDHYVATPAK